MLRLSRRSRLVRDRSVATVRRMLIPHVGVLPDWKRMRLNGI